ncbi:flagellar protein FlaG [Paucibacter sp. O1-1]|nr:flagellar protein FlaG [Paucibacter sp. O1-1]MDA3827955.1 flagellar protein FlaG [Paucibacter sp. O1-1]
MTASCHRFNRYGRNDAKGLKFSVDDDSGKRVIKVQDIESGDIIRQIPSEEALQLAQKISEVSGVLMKIEV